jgi:hypothetical protein
MEHEDSLLYSQDPATGPCPESDESSPHLPTLFPQDSAQLTPKLNTGYGTFPSLTTNVTIVHFNNIFPSPLSFAWPRGCIQKFPDLPLGARTANDTAVT